MADALTLEQLAEHVANLAEWVGTGRASHMVNAGQNAAIDIANALRPGGIAPPEPEKPFEVCGAKKDDKPDTLVCILEKGHHYAGGRPSGHSYGVPEYVEEAVQAP